MNYYNDGDMMVILDTNDTQAMIRYHRELAGSDLVMNIIRFHPFTLPFPFPMEVLYYGSGFKPENIAYLITLKKRAR